MENYAKKLITKLYDKKIKKTLDSNLKESTKTCLYGFMDYLNALTKTHVKKDVSNNAEYIIGTIFKNIGLIRKQVEYNNFMKASLSLANNKFNGLVKIIEGDDPKMKHNTIMKFSDLINDYIKDLKPFIEYFERKKKPDFILFNGWKSYNNETYELAMISNNLYWNGFYKENIFDQKMAINIACFTLRQALEIKFKRICGIYDIYNRKFDGPKLRHDFFPEFIDDNSDLLELPYVHLTDLIKVYKWTNLTIHNAENPMIWELRFALDYVNPFFKWGELVNKNGSSVKSVHGAVIIKDYDELKKRLMDKINQISNDIFCIEFIKPEAFIE
ncbi:hypothetical protein [Pedobacter cryoconitis]|uniref:hypothetical protein n=1 Tax=Pedobacter cryoconitis TaxID=188932 RepID=UPI001607975F|nr:hypothetical protein [Pedobacter cryoconitis]MBB5645915.1 hypothetical protein [Pedobacter cryoconitis]